MDYDARFAKRDMVKVVARDYNDEICGRLLESDELYVGLSPSGEIDLRTCAASEKRAKDNCELEWYQEDNWKGMARDGWRIVKIKITAVDP